MQKKIGIFTSVIALILFIFLFFPTRPASATGPNLVEGSDGYLVSADTILYYNITVCDPNLGASIGEGDYIRVRITTANNSQLPQQYVTGPLGAWTADALFSHLDYYNKTEGLWNYGNESISTGYNSTDPYNNVSNSVFGEYYFYSHSLFMGFMQLNGLPLMDIGCNNFSALNHTLVNMTYAFFTMSGPNPSFNHTSPGGTIEGTWEIWNGTATTPNSYKYVYTFNASGICNRTAFYMNGTTDWNLLFETQIFQSSTPPNEGFTVFPGDFWTHTVTVCHASLNLNITVGSKLLFNVTKINSSTLSNFSSNWRANVLYGHYMFYNITSGNWTDIRNGEEDIIAAYNGINTYDNYSNMFFGQYYSYSEGYMMGFMQMGIPMLEIVPINLTAANHTLVNTTYAFFTQNGPDPTFNYTLEIGTNYKWIIWNGTSTTSGSKKFEFTVDSQGICIRNAMYVADSSGWLLVYESTISGIPSGFGEEELFTLLSLLAGSGDFFTTGTLIGMGISAAIFLLPLLIGLGIRREK
ncbi:MAG: hypothetical protein ACTSO9_13425 [Candidatus Helarchaeota archaeon]